jgi:type IV pilus assembly protein PilM
MGKNRTQTNFYKHRPVFGFDIGHGSLKVMQLSSGGKKPRLIGYGTGEFDSTAIVDGVVVNPEALAKATLNLFKHRLIGDITTGRAVFTIPSYRSYSRAMQLPQMKPKELEEAVRLEIEQYTPLPLADLYLDYTVTTQTNDTIEVFAVAIPKKIVDSYLQFARIVGLEPLLLETTMSAAGRLFSLDSNKDLATVIIDFGSLSSDVCIYRGNVLVTGTVPAGGLVFTKSIADNLGVSTEEAATIKIRYGLSVSKKQPEIVRAIEPTLTQLCREIRRMVRYYEERYGTSHPISQLVMLGGGANMPGLSDYMTDQLRIPVRTYDPWRYLDAHRLQLPALPDHPMFSTVAGLSLVSPNEVFAT